MTRSLGSWERLLMMLSVIPSERYSAFGSALALMKGRIASEFIALRDRKRPEGDEPRPESGRTRRGFFCGSDCRAETARSSLAALLIDFAPGSSQFASAWISLLSLLRSMSNSFIA